MPEIRALQIAPIYYFYSRTPDHTPLFSKTHVRYLQF